jgi:GT2 family glycosyltransferase
MSDHQIAGLTNGYLPLAAFEHLDPTMTGIVDLERSVRPVPPVSKTGTGGVRDGLLLVRLHGQPLSMVHVDGDPTSMSESEVAEAIWHAARPAISDHVERFGCTSMPASATELIDGTHLNGNCPSEARGLPQESVAVIVCTTGGRGDQLRRCLRSLRAQVDLEFELILVDNRPDRGTTREIVEPLAAEDERVRYAPEPRPGLSVARNRGIAETDADLVAFIDDDVVADPTWLRWLVAPFSQRGVAATSGMVLPLELETPAQKRFEQYAGFSKGVEPRRYDRNGGVGAERLLYPFLGDVFGGGASMAFRRQGLLAAGGFDPVLGAGSPTKGGEDMLAFTEAVLRGGETVYEPRSVCWHEHRKDTDALQEQVSGWGIGLGAVLTKLLLTEPRFYAAALRSVPVAADLLRSRRKSARSETVRGGASTRPGDMLRVQRRGISRGPALYLKSVRRARRLGLRDVTHSR